MSTPFTTASAPPAVPPTREFTAAWIAYLMMVLSAFLFWPALIALLISYSKRGRSEAGFIDSHHRWMIRSFWYSQLWFLVFFVLVVAGVWPVIENIARQVLATGDWNENTFALSIDWKAIFTTVGAAMIGGLGVVVTWFWFIYRMVRGMIVLADARALP
jgi:uncharacterized membrane protein